MSIFNDVLTQQKIRNNLNQRYFTSKDRDSTIVDPQFVMKFPNLVKFDTPIKISSLDDLLLIASHEKLRKVVLDFTDFRRSFKSDYNSSLIKLVDGSFGLFDYSNEDYDYIFVHLTDLVVFFILQYKLSRKLDKDIEFKFLFPGLEIVYKPGSICVLEPYRDPFYNIEDMIDHFAGIDLDLLTKYKGNFIYLPENHPWEDICFRINNSSFLLESEFWSEPGDYDIYGHDYMIDEYRLRSVIEPFSKLKRLGFYGADEESSSAIKEFKMRDFPVDVYQLYEWDCDS